MTTTIWQCSADWDTDLQQLQCSGDAICQARCPAALDVQHGCLRERRQHLVRRLDDDVCMLAIAAAGQGLLQNQRCTREGVGMAG